MKFFMPEKNTAEEAQKAYEQIRAFLEDAVGSALSMRRIQSISFRINGKPLVAEVGQVNPLNREVVLAILYDPAWRMYHICTQNSGNFPSGSNKVRWEEVRSCVDFE